MHVSSEPISGAYCHVHEQLILSNEEQQSQAVNRIIVGYWPQLGSVRSYTNKSKASLNILEVTRNEIENFHQ